LTGDEAGGWTSAGHDCLRVWYRLRDAHDEASGRPKADELLVLLGDDAELQSHPGTASLANASTFAFQASTGTITVYTSIVGLPPVFLYSDGRRIILVTDLYLLASLPDVHLELDPTGVAELGRIGHPVGHRTLFKNTSLLPSGSKVTANLDAGVTVERAWRLPEADPVTWPQLIDIQAGTFIDAVRRIDVSRSVLSLTAGLDTRTLFSALAKQNRLVPTVTICGVHPSLDARTASRLSQEYGVPHWSVVVGEQFTRGLPDYVQRASRLSGGLLGLREAPEVYLYHQLGGRFAARLSGNLGNQVGRAGTEGVGMRCARVDILTPAVRDAARMEKGHWLLDKLKQGGPSAIEFILQHEVPFSRVGNFAIGNHFAIQQSPYADRGLIETMALRPAGGASPSGSLTRMRLMDLRHRFIGEPKAFSFQRSLLDCLGGFASTYPINFGWRATGGVSLRGTLWGAFTFMGMIAEKRRLDDGVLGRAFNRIGLADLYDFHRAPRWLRHDLRDFTRDILHSRAVQEAGIFDRRALATVLDAHFTGAEDHFQTVTFALDVALAQQIFCSHH
jgi:hypothetical protein